MVHCYLVKRKDGQWHGYIVEYNLTSEGSSPASADAKLMEHILDLKKNPRSNFYGIFSLHRWIEYLWLEFKSWLAGPMTTRQTWITYTMKIG